MRRDMHSDVGIKRSIPPAAYTNNDATTNGTWVNIRDKASVEACVTFNDTADVLAAGLNWEVFVQKAKDDGAGAADAGTVLSLTEGEYLGPASGLLTPGDGSGVAFIDAPAEDAKEYRAGLHLSLGAGYEWVRMVLRGNGNHANGSVAYGWFNIGGQERPVAVP